MKMIEGTLDRKSKRIMVRVATFVSLLLGGMLVEGATGAEDTTSPRSSVIIGDAATATGSSTTMMTTTTVVDGVPVPVPVLTRKLTKNSKASKDDAGVSEEVQSLLRLLVFEKAVDLNRFLMEQSSFEDALVENNYKEYACTGCVGLFTSGTQLPPDEQDAFCQKVILQVLNKIGRRWGPKNTVIYLSLASLPLNQYCNELLQCPSTPTMCCQSQGLCLATDGATGPTDGDGIPPGGHCSTTNDCAIPVGLTHGVCRTAGGSAHWCQSGQPGARCGQSSDCVVITDLDPPHAVCRENRCQSGQPGSWCGVTNDCVVQTDLDPPHAVCRGPSGSELHKCQR